MQAALFSTDDHVLMGFEYWAQYPPKTPLVCTHRQLLPVHQESSADMTVFVQPEKHFLALLIVQSMKK